MYRIPNSTMSLQSNWTILRARNYGGGGPGGLDPLVCIVHHVSPLFIGTMGIRKSLLE